MESISAVCPPEPRTMQRWEGAVRGADGGRREGRMAMMRNWKEGVSGVGEGEKGDASRMRIRYVQRHW
jgi:hypothetical protein